jgi:hypothetical protein
MARITRDTVDYFPHYANASEGDTLTILQSRYGNDGYAFWFKLLERLSSAEGHYIDCRNPIKWQIFIAKMGVKEITTVEILNLLVEMQAIDGELWKSKLIWCQKLVDNVADVYQNRRRSVPQKPITTNDNAITTVEMPISTPEIPQSKVKESKVNKTKGKENIEKKPYGEFKNVFLSDDELKNLNERFNGNTQWHIERLSAGIASKGYKYKDCYAAILRWARKDEKDGNVKADTKEPPADFSKEEQEYQRG